MELKPCPFCGSNKISYAKHTGYGNIWCSGCGCNSGDHKSFKKAAAAWNKRAGDKDEIKERILTRLYAFSGVCTYCNEKKCACENKRLPTVIESDIVLKSINYENYFGLDDDMDDNP